MRIAAPITGLLSLILSLTLAGCVAPGAQPAPAGASPSGTQLFISKSAVFFPESAPGFTLASKYQYPDVSAGVQLTYAAATLPQAKLDFFVYAIGRGPQDAALQRGMEDIHLGVDEAQRRGMYSEVVFGTESGIEVPAADGGTLKGRQQPLTFTDKYGSYVSAGYIFYKQLYIIEMRISAPDLLTPEILAKTGDLAVKEIVPLIHVLNKGSCQDVDVAIDTNGPGDFSARMAAATSKAVAERKAEGCPVDADALITAGPKQGEGVFILEYTAANWH
jgi:hypothetical protein